MKNSTAGPVVMPWHSGHWEEILIYALVGIVAAIIGTTVLTHYRAAQGRPD